MRFLRIKIAVVAVVFAAAIALAQSPKRVACIGNSITWGYTLPDPAGQCYPAQLSRLLEASHPGEYVVERFAMPGATLLNNGFKPYMALSEFRQALEFKPDIAVIHLGVNDTDPRAWPHYNNEFVTDYLSLIDSLRAVNPQVRIILANLSPLRAGHPRFRAGTYLWRKYIRQAIERIAEISGAELIDFGEPLKYRQWLIPDNIHPDVEGSGLLAAEAYGAITGRWGGLQMPPVYGDGMVMQRDRFLDISGRADAGSRIELKIGGRTYHAKADNRGRWTCKISPLVVGEPYTLEVTDGTTTLTFRDILAGEVWLASGQSNMAFPMHSQAGADSILSACDDPLLRFFSMEPRVFTDNVEWDTDALLSNRNLNHYRPTQWRSSSSANSRDWSAVAWCFARALRDSLQVPVGIISNPIGGSPTEAWIAIDSLEAAIPEIIVGWPDNHFVQPWVGKRAKKNVGAGTLATHPYAPGYLFACGIEPLGRYPIAGIVWYQGESNAHNIEIHNTLFPLLVSSWRDYFRDPDLTFCFAQLSSLNRPSWAEFRDSQRRLSESISRAPMVVTADHGDSLDVHPTRKDVVGQRMARAVLATHYGRDLEAFGPQPVSASSVGGKIELIFDHADGLTTSDGSAPREFEIAEVEGYYLPANATISGNKIILNNDNMATPKYVRYAWRPFSRGNVINSAALPASTFKMEIDNLADFQPEPGIEVGVSAPFAFSSGSNIIVAGGCNFPKDPMAANSQKHFYQGIYMLSPDDDFSWRKIGQLPTAMAYGATAQIADGKAVIVGGTSAIQGLKDAYLIEIVDGAPRLTQLPSMPHAIDNMAVTTVGDVVYIIGGNVDGRPSRKIYALDTANLDRGWRHVATMPGNPRVQPVAAAITRPSEAICIWGGFAGRDGKKLATLETTGLLYDITTGRFSPLPAPTDSEGCEVTLSGGVAIALDDHRILATGGVNKDIFLEALNNQAPDYLDHPIQWYRFNGKIFEFDADAHRWQLLDEQPDASRAGAAIVKLPDQSITLIGGELKPRIRTSHLLHLHP